ncbi:unnamed protein product [Bursaphelenchus xylophilus]|uniref:(pine wood nematode) hypothetical protein n=1 Tax=Bursaphelenchus xylophilus TaxID=6326 RepID=A0A1I7S4P0_BURXY|nr:unnamed protein product [Bursaphelenchus xylophilus]CAG9117265.1 unnamed protein product [Bursaphelenchus xylophilus]
MILGPGEAIRELPVITSSLFLFWDFAAFVNFGIKKMDFQLFRNRIPTALPGLTYEYVDVHVRYDQLGRNLFISGTVSFGDYVVQRNPISWIDSHNCSLFDAAGARFDLWIGNGANVFPTFQVWSLSRWMNLNPMPDWGVPGFSYSAADHPYNAVADFVAAGLVEPDPDEPSGPPTPNSMD